MKKFLYLGAALAALALCGPASAAGYYTNGLPVLNQSVLTGTETIPLDTNYTGGASPQTAAVTTASLNTFFNGGTGTTGAAVAGAVTINDDKGVVTSESLTTANAAAYTLTLTNSFITAASVISVSVGNGTNTTGGSTLATVTPGAGSATIVIYNRSGAAALNGTITVAFRVL